ncbi:MAG TPA: hypothetical protein VMT68_09980 [Caulobacteraceae bacterium]|nr:hypothetical protein [Caulobacteraceae bacterium]
MKLSSIMNVSLAVLASAIVMTVAAPTSAVACPKGDVRVHVCERYAGHKGEALKITGKCLKYDGWKCYPRHQVIK